MALRNRKSAYVDENVAVAQFNGVTIDARIWLLGQLARSYIILPAVPRASHELAVQVTFAERAAVVQAYTIDCKQLTVDIGDSYRLAGHLKLANLSLRNFVLLRGAFESQREAPTERRRSISATTFRVKCGTRHRYRGRESAYSGRD